MMSRGHEILYLHGLESGPTGSKGTWLTEHHGAYGVDLDTSHARVSHRKAQEAGVGWNHLWPEIEADFQTPLERARAAIGPETRLIVGSSFGGAVLTRLLAEGTWTGPSLLIAGAGLKLTGAAKLATEARTILLHGRDDDVVPLEDAREIAAQSGPSVMLWEIGDGHRMKSIMLSGVFDLAVRWLLSGSDG